MQIIFFLTLFITLFFLSRQVTSTLSLFFLRVTRSNTFAIQFLAILFLPGVIIHELAHWLFASILFVPTGDIEFLPQVQGDNVKLGSVQIAQTDPFRRFFIGVAPVLLGLLVLLGIFFYISPTVFPITWRTYFFLYSVFEIENTMFSSKKDMEGVFGFLILLGLFTSLLIFLHVPFFSLTEKTINMPFVKSLFDVLNTFFLFAIGIDSLIIVIFLGLIKVFKKRFY